MEEMTTAELNQYLENIAKLIEATADNTEEAALLLATLIITVARREIKEVLT